MTKQRKKFEKWYEDFCLPAEADWFRREKDDPEEYLHANTHFAWMAWQAASAASEAAQPTGWCEACKVETGTVRPCDVCGKQTQPPSAQPVAVQDEMPVRYYKDGGITYAVYGSSSIDYVERLRARQEEISSLNSHITKLEKNALRYRKLRSWHCSESDFCVVANPKENVKLGVMCPSGQVLDGLLDLYLEEDKN